MCDRIEIASRSRNLLDTLRANMKFHNVIRAEYLHPPLPPRGTATKIVFGRKYYIGDVQLVGTAAVSEVA